MAHIKPSRGKSRSLRNVLGNKRQARKKAAAGSPSPRFSAFTGKLRIFIVEDHEALRQATSNLLACEAGIVICGEANNNEDALKRIKESKPDLVITDILHPGKDGIELTEDILALYPEIIVVIMSLAEGPLAVEAALHAGARGYFVKRDGPRQLVTTIQRVLAGQIYVSRSISSKLSPRPHRKGRRF